MELREWAMRGDVPIDLCMCTWYCSHSDNQGSSPQKNRNPVMQYNTFGPLLGYAPILDLQFKEQNPVLNLCVTVTQSTCDFLLMVVGCFMYIGGRATERLFWGVNHRFKGFALKFGYAVGLNRRILWVSHWYPGAVHDKVWHYNTYLVHIYIYCNICHTTLPARTIHNTQQ